MRYSLPVKSHSLLNLTPLIDIVFLLLVFFMLTAHFVDEQQIVMQLPQSSSEEALAQTQVVTIAIDAQGQIYLDNAVIDKPDLPLRLQALSGQHVADTLHIQLRADQTTSFEHIVYVLDQVRQTGLTQLEIVTNSL